MNPSQTEQPAGNLVMDEQATIRHLAQLSDLDYHREKRAAAETLGITVTDLNGLVRKTKAKGDAASQSSDDFFDEVEPWASPINGTELLNELATFTHRFVVCDTHTADAIALWITFTWVIDAVTVAPIANITAPQPNCGKSTLLDLLELLCYRPLKTDNVSPAALFRSIEKWQPTLLIDEVDSFLKDNESARGILNSGHKRNGAVLRVVGDNHEPRKFSTWGAKALCGIGAINRTLASRSIRFELRRKLAHESVENLRHVSRNETHALQRKLARFALDAHLAISASRPTPIAGLNNRAQDNWEPLLAIADVAGGDWPERARHAAVSISNLEAQPTDDDAGIELLRDIQAIFKQQERNKIFTADLLASLCANEESPWATWNRGNAISARQLSRKLNDFGIRSDDIRMGQTVRKGYALTKFQDAFARYLPS